MPHSPEPGSAVGAGAAAGTPRLDRSALFAHWDALTPEQLRAQGSMKWTMFPGTIGAWVAESDLGTAPAVTAALHAAIDAGQLGYLPRPVAAAHAAATSDWMRDRYDWEVPRSRVHHLADVISGLDVAIEHYSRPGSAVIVPTPAYMPFLTVPQRHGRTVIEVALAEVDGRAALDLAAIDRELAAGAGLVVLCNPLNPGGRVFARDELAALAEVVERHGARVFADEVHAPIVFDGARHVPYASVSTAAASHSITVTSASKAFNLPGAKAAQLILTNDADEAVWQKLGPMAGHGASILGIIANTAAYRDGRDWLAATVTYYDENRRALSDLLSERLPEVGYRMPEGTYIAWLDVARLGLGDDPAATLRERAGLAVTDGRACGAAGAGHVRVILATPRPLVERIVDALVTAAHA
ncbi:MalY/PatB family protein [Microcella frigidaquae]|uniref:cysteine-S-conjugate beta-lyase n=1 Tax=Microcella frigidaquae TaxID=424758 RepID=A0A840XH91_9MICO|nr:aminotransferase class I/II-fold pyridoxal phosphate-dependent enzyme [Microcella frigidaquae]MBB5617872.1 cystathionine beta-lyase [Microcella frigidaquae]NHN44414.1 aminotransferase class I/II-fold pyridoxal phosphate-dependent enzyme [Microcella frigidaquae]